MIPNEKPGAMAGAFRWNRENSIVFPHRAGRKGAMRPNFDPTRLVDEWSLPGLSATDRMRITAELFSADSDFKALDFQGEDLPFVKPMQDAFTGIASILFDGHLLTVAILENELRLFVIDSAVTANWVLFHDGIDKERIDHFAKQQIFEAHIAKWKGRLLQREADKATSTSVSSPTATQPVLKRMSATTYSPVAARKLAIYLEANSIGVTQFAIQAKTTDRTIRSFRKTGRVRKDIFENIAAAMHMTKEALLKD